VRVLIVKMSAMGDIIHALPVLDYLHQASPGIEIDWLVEEPFLDVVAGNPLIAKVQVARSKAWRKRPLCSATLAETGALKRALQERDYHIVFDIQGNIKSGIYGWLTGVENRIGFDADVLQERLNMLFTTRRIPLRSQDSHITDQYLRLVSVPFGRDYREMQLKSDIHTTPEDDTAAEALLSTLADGLVFLFQYGTTWQTKFWREESWIALGKELLARFPDSSVLLSWGNDHEHRVVMGIAAAIGTGARVIDRYSLKGLTALLKKVDLVIGGDTGPVHLAAAVGTATVSFYRASDGKRSGPRGDNHVVIQAPMPCSRCFRTKCDRDDECRQSITVDAVVQGAIKILS
jgi:heptosyltransferase-1